MLSAAPAMVVGYQTMFVASLFACHRERILATNGPSIEEVKGIPALPSTWHR